MVSDKGTAFQQQPLPRSSGRKGGVPTSGLYGQNTRLRVGFGLLFFLFAITAITYHHHYPAFTANPCRLLRPPLRRDPVRFRPIALRLMIDPRIPPRIRYRQRIRRRPRRNSDRCDLAALNIGDVV